MHLCSVRSMSILGVVLLATFMLPLSSANSFSSPMELASVANSKVSAKESPAPSEVNVLIVYYSVTGNTEKMAKSVAEGVQQVAGATVIIKRAEVVATDDIKNADAMVLGSPTYYGDMAAPMKSFIDDWWLKHKVSLVDKIGGAFSTGAGGTGGKEHVLQSLIIAMMNGGMIPVGSLVEQFGLPGVSALAPVNESALEEARALGTRVANVAQRMKAGSVSE